MSSKKTFADKHGLKDKGRPVRISKELSEEVDELNKQAERVIEAGEFYAKTEKRRFGQD